MQTVWTCEHYRQMWYQYKAYAAFCISVDCLVAIAIVSPSITALLLQCTHMHNLPRRLLFWLSFGNGKKLHPHPFPPWRQSHKKHQIILNKEKLVDDSFSAFGWTSLIALSHSISACAFRCNHCFRADHNLNFDISLFRMSICSELYSFDLHNIELKCSEFTHIILKLTCVNFPRRWFVNKRNNVKHTADLFQETPDILVTYICWNCNTSSAHNRVGSVIPHIRYTDTVDTLSAYTVCTVCE